MIWNAVFAYLHLLAVGTAAALLVTQHWLLKRPVDRAQARLLGAADLAWLFALIAALATGIGRAQFDGGIARYLDDHLFLLKLGVLAAILIVSVLPTRQFIRWNREARTVPAFAPLTIEVERAQAAVALELGLLALVPFLSVLVAGAAGG